MRKISGIAESRIKEIIEYTITAIIEKKFTESPFNHDQFCRESPFNAALVPEEVWKSSRFERAFVTSMGMSIYESVACILGKEIWGKAEHNYRSTGLIFRRQVDKIQEILTELQHPKESGRSPNWVRECEELTKCIGGDKIRVEIISDVYLEDEAHKKRAYLELKAPKPNADQTKESKDKMLKLFCISLGSDFKTFIFYGLPYNPYIRREDYAWPHPKRYFDMINDPAIKIGKELWDIIGGEGTYENLLDIFNEVGKTTKRIIRKELLDKR